MVQGMRGFARNDEVKKVLVEKGALDVVLPLLTAGSESEIEEAARLLWELSFDEENKAKIKVKGKWIDDTMFFSFGTPISGIFLW